MPFVLFLKSALKWRKCQFSIHSYIEYTCILRRPLKGTGYGIRIRVKYTWFKIKNYVTCIVILAKKNTNNNNPPSQKILNKTTTNPPPPKSASWSIRHIIKGFTFPLAQHRWTIEKTAPEVIPQALKEEKRYGKQGLSLY